MTGLTLMTTVHSPTPLTGQTALVTGGASGLGKALCAQLALRGARVMLADIDAERASLTAQQLSKTAGTISSVVCDVGDPDQVTQVLEQTLSRFGHLDILINNAGTDVTLPIGEMTLAHWERVQRTNLHGPFLLARAVTPHMIARGSGQIINITSTAAKRAWPNASAYHASKTGLLGLSHALHAELRPAGIKVTAVVVGGMATPFLLDRFPDINRASLQDPANVALAICDLLALPRETVVAEITVLPMTETSWP